MDKVLITIQFLHDYFLRFTPQCNFIIIHDYFNIYHHTFLHSSSTYLCVFNFSYLTFIHILRYIQLHVGQLNNQEKKNYYICMCLTNAIFYFFNYFFTLFSITTVFFKQIKIYSDTRTVIFFYG